MYHIKLHRSYRTVVAICDTDLLGKKFEDGKMQLDVRENFYKDKEITKEELIRMMISQEKEDATFNIVGKDSVQIALEAGIITKGNIGAVQGIQFALTLI